jgi:c-di-GMP-binding flagellar brake protein YcgR
MVLGAAVFAARGVYRFVTSVVMYRPGRPSPLVLSPPESFEWIDRRAEPRITASLPVTCVPVVSAQRSRAEAAGFAATTVDLSLGGMAVTTDQPVSPGQELRVAFLLPRGDNVTARTTVVSVEPPTDGRPTIAHLQIDDMDPWHRDRFGAFLHEVLFLSAGEPATELLRQPLVTSARSA